MSGWKGGGVRRRRRRKGRWFPFWNLALNFEFQMGIVGMINLWNS